MLKFAANLTMWYPERPFLERFARAKLAGFDAVEFMFPYEASADRVREAIKEQEQMAVLFNLPAGDWARGERGVALFPERADEFMRGVDQAVAYANAIDCPRINCLAGICPPNLPREVAWQTLIERVRYAADALAADGRTLLIEAINHFDIPRFLVRTVDEALMLAEVSGRDNVRVQYDVYHQQRTQGELIGTFRRLKDHISHIQIADNPGRHQPGTGEINFANLWRAFEEAQYSGYIGLEYLPSGDDAEHLAWWHNYQDIAARTG